MSNYQTLLPMTSTPLERAIEASCAKRCQDFDYDLSGLYSADNCPVQLLPWLAWSISAPAWDDNWTEAEKRQAIRVAIALNRKRGTVWAVKEALKTASLSVNLIEWWQTSPKGLPHTFTARFLVNSSYRNGRSLFADLAIYKRLKILLDEYKPVRSHYNVKVGVELDQPLQIAQGIGLHATQVATTKLKVKIRAMASQLTCGLGLGLHATMQRTVTL